ncbi:MAG: LCP family protein [Spirochaetales bacterium]|nr:LCP family protein [Spirochaetales bacterium]
MKRKGKIDKSIFLIILIIITLVSAVIFSYFYLRVDALTEKMQKNEPFSIMFTVSDKNALCFLEVFFFNPETKKGGIFYFPPNVGAKIDSINRVDEIGVLYNRKDILPLKKQVELLIGGDINFFMDFELESLGKLVDLMEGIEIFISNPVDTVFKGKRILFPSGNVLFDGDKIIDFIVYTEDNEEEREIVSRRQKFLQALLKKLGETKMTEYLMKKNSFSFFLNSITTNITSKDLQTFVKEMSLFDSDRLLFQNVMGKSVQVEDKLLNFPLFEGELLKSNVKQMLETMASAISGDNVTLNIGIEILNGTDVNGLAGRTAKLFESFGYDIVSVQNADSDEYEETVVIDRVGKKDIAQKAADYIKCEKVISKVSPGLDENIDISIIIGKDFDGRYCKK